jgi:hypothetical protein
MVGKLTRLPFKEGGKSSSQKLDMLHMNVIGELPVPGESGEGRKEGRKNYIQDQPLGLKRTAIQ